MYYTVKNEQVKAIYDEDELAQAVFNTIKWYKDCNKNLALRNQKLHDEAEEVVRHEFEAEIAHLKERLALSYGEFASQKEKDAYKDFEQRHMHERQIMKIQGGRAPYLIPTGTGIGTHLEVVCPICGEKENITDWDVW